MGKYKFRFSSETQGPIIRVPFVPHLLIDSSLHFAFDLHLFKHFQTTARGQAHWQTVDFSLQFFF